MIHCSSHRIHKNVSFLQYALEHDMKLSADWYHASKLSLNVVKMVLLKFWPEGKSFEMDIGRVNIKNAHQTKFLGVQ